jgi:metallo-beta-lactamase family protein
MVSEKKSPTRSHIKMQFLGGVADGDNLTGSGILLEIRRGKKLIKILVDAGLKQGGRDALEQNREILKYVNPVKISYVILTHSHIDHVGLLPFLAKHGFNGRIICTQATAELLPVMLEDSAKIQLTEVKNKNSQDYYKTPHSIKSGRDSLTLGSYDRKKWKNRSKRSKTSEVLYTMDDVKTIVRLVKNQGFAYETWIRLEKDIALKFYPSGHVLGGAVCVLKVEGQEPLHLGFSGDLGREDGIILPPPKLPDEPLNYWVIESTYGGEKHPERDEEIAKLLALVKKAGTNKQKIIIPSFALERAQEVIYILSDHMSKGDIPALPIYLDSPLANRITNIFATNWQIGLFNDQGRVNFNPFSPIENRFFQIVIDKASSVALIKEDGPAIIIAGSGMCDAGRVRDHLRAGLSSPKTIVCLVGYMAENSLGRKLQNGLPIIRMNGEDIIVKAEIVNFQSFSAHADGTFLAAYTENILKNESPTPANIFINHGEEMPATLLKLELSQALKGGAEQWLNNITIPKLHEIFNFSF